MSNEYIKLYKKKNRNKIIEHFFNTNDTILEKNPGSNVHLWNCHVSDYYEIENHDGLDDKSLIKKAWDELLKKNWDWSAKLPSGKPRDWPALFIKQRNLGGRPKKIYYTRCYDGYFFSFTGSTDVPNYDMWTPKKKLPDESEDGLATKCNKNTHYVGKKANPPYDTVCNPYTVSESDCSSNEYLFTPTIEKDRECKPLTNCTPDEYISKAHTPTSDRVCTPYTKIKDSNCKKDQYFDAGFTNRDRKCTPHTKCTSDQYESKKPDSTTDRQCIDLKDWQNRILIKKEGTVDSGANFKCQTYESEEHSNNNNINTESFVKYLWGKLLAKKWHEKPGFWPAVFIKERNHGGRAQIGMIAKCKSGDTYLMFTNHPYNYDMYTLKPKLPSESEDGLITKCDSNHYELKKANPLLEDTICIKCNSCNGKIKTECSKYDDTECCVKDPNSKFNNRDKMNCDFTCNNGYYKDNNNCKKCTICGLNNSGLLEKCTSEKDTVCRDCTKAPNSTYKSNVGCDWECNDRHELKNKTCIPCNLPANATYKSNKGCDWECNDRHELKNGECIPCNLPANATYKSNKGCEFECNDRHELVNGECIACIKPLNSTYTDTIGCNWKCNERTIEKNGECIGCNMPDNAKYKSDIGCEYECENRFKKKDGKCVSCDVPNSTYTSDIGCEFKCDNRFFEKNDKCVSCNLPNNATYTSNVGCEWKCDNRFYEKDDKCISCKLPDNATYITDTGCEFKCNNRFYEKDNSCVKCRLPDNANFSSNEGCEWECNNRFFEKDNNCVKCELPDNATFSSDTGCNWECNNRYEREGNKCIKCDLPENATYTNDTGCEWECDKQFYNRDNKYCLSCELPKNASYENDENCKWKCNDGYFRNYNKCIKCTKKCPDYYDMKKECSTEEDMLCEPCKKPENSYFVNEKDCIWRCNDGFYHKNGKCTTTHIELKKSILTNTDNLMKVVAFIILFIIYLYVKNNIPKIIANASTYSIIFIELLVVCIIIKIFVLDKDKNTFN